MLQNEKEMSHSVHEGVGECGWCVGKWRETWKKNEKKNLFCPNDRISLKKKKEKRKNKPKVSISDVSRGNVEPALQTDKKVSASSLPFWN